MQFKTILYEKRDRIAYFTLNRPERLNAFNSQMREDLSAAFIDFDEDPEVWLGIVSGSGRCFSAGGDMKDRHKPTSPRIDYHFDHPANWKPMIAAIHSHCAGWGLNVAIDCDLLVATEDASFFAPEAKVGIPEGTLWARLWFWIGSKRATEMAITGDPMTGEEAYRRGLVSRLVEKQEELLPAAEALAKRILENPPMGVRTTIQASRRAVQHVNRDAEILFENSRWREWEDYKEAVEAFKEKRKPVYKGR